MMGISGFATKKELKGAVGRYIGNEPTFPPMFASTVGELLAKKQPKVYFIETSMFGNEYKGDGNYTVVGPDPLIRKWYATITVQAGRITKVT